MMLTKTKPDGKWCVIGADGKIVPWKDVPVSLYGALCKLHAYERHGLSPEAVERLRDENTRLLISKNNNCLIAENRRLKALVDAIEDVLKGSENNG